MLRGKKKSGEVAVAADNFPLPSSMSQHGDRLALVYHTLGLYFYMSDSRLIGLESDNAYQDRCFFLFRQAFTCQLAANDYPYPYSAPARRTATDGTSFF